MAEMRNYVMNFSIGRPAPSRLPGLTCQGKLASTEVHRAVPSDVLSVFKLVCHG
jgi:hypothetical protein